MTKTYVNDPPVCECCHRKVHETFSKNICTESNICRDCFYEWYEGGSTDPEVIKVGVWKKHGEFGGEANLSNGPRLAQGEA